MLTACTPQEQPYQTEPSHKPELKKDVFFVADGSALPYRQWLPKTKPKAVVIALHGFNDYSRAFDGLGAYLSARGVAVYAYDQRGFGKAPMRGIWGGQRNYTSDLAAWVEHLRNKYPKRPLYILGESMGAAVAINALTTESFPQPDGAILASPAVWGGEAMNPAYRIMAMLSAHIMPGYTVTGSDLKIKATDNMEMLRQMSLDPLVIKATRFDAMYGLVKLMDHAYENVSKLNVPVLVVYGGKDEVIPPAIIKQSALFSVDSVGCLYYSDGYHMILRGLNARFVLEDIYDWLWKNKGKTLLTSCNK